MEAEGKGDRLDLVLIAVGLVSAGLPFCEKSGVDLGHFTGDGNLRDHSSHIEVDAEVAQSIIDSISGSQRETQKHLTDENAKLVCEISRGSRPRGFARGRRPPVSSADRQ